VDGRRAANGAVQAQPTAGRCGPAP
jgi:hypothetical protein